MHKEIAFYENKEKKCECNKCELSDTCQYEYKYLRLPCEEGGLGLCKKLKKQEGQSWKEK